MDIYKQIIRPTLILTAIIVVISLLLAITYKVTRQKPDPLKEFRQAKTIAKQLLPQADDFEGKAEYLVAKNGAGRVVKQAAKGYNKDIVIMVGFDNKNTVRGIKILEQEETPGLGTDILKPKFLNQFVNKSAPFSKDFSSQTSKIDALTGATISSKAVINAVNKAMEAKQ